MARSLTLVLVVGAVLAVVGSAVDPDCFQYSSCSACTEAPSGRCGWDPSNQFCKEGNSGGPSSTIGWSGNWWWTSQQCCSSSVHCSSCVDSGFCGWDVNQGKCLRGTSWGPATGSVPESWISPWASAACPTQCQQNGDCSSCNQAGCGWLENAQQCVAGNANGAFMGQPAVQSLIDSGVSMSSNNWYYANCPSNWRLRWSANSYSLWCIVGSVGTALLVTSIVAGRRRRRLIREQRRQMAAFAGQAQPTVGAPLLAQAADVQPTYPAQPIYGQPAPMPYYGATPEDGTCSGEVKTIY